MDPVWWNKWEKGKKFLASLQEGEEFVLYGRNKFCMVASHVSMLFMIGVMLKMLIDSFDGIAKEHPQYEEVSKELTLTVGKLSSVLKAIDKADKLNEMVPGEDQAPPASA
jgi:hypothetical protein